MSPLDIEFQVVKKHASADELQIRYFTQTRNWLVPPVS